MNTALQDIPANICNIKQYRFHGYMKLFINLSKFIQIYLILHEFRIRSRALVPAARHRPRVAAGAREAREALPPRMRRDGFTARNFLRHLLILLREPRGFRPLRRLAPARGDCAATIADARGAQEPQMRAVAWSPRDENTRKIRRKTRRKPKIWPRMAIGSRNENPFDERVAWCRGVELPRRGVAGNPPSSTPPNRRRLFPRPSIRGFAATQDEAERGC